MRQLLAVGALVAALVLSACGDDDTDAAPSDGDTTTTVGPRFCDAYLEYLGDSSDEHLDEVVAASGDDQVAEYAEIIETGRDITEILAATLDLDDLARQRCQPEWTAGAQGAGSTAAAAQAFFDALVAGDRAGARNVASANAIAVFEPWEPLGSNAEAGTPALAEVGSDRFSMALHVAMIAQCQVETGVVVSCQIAE